MNNNEENPQMKGYEVHNNESNSNNSLAITGFILSFFIPIAGLIVSIMGLKKAKQIHDNGKGFAIAGIIISSIFLGLSLIFTLLFILIFIGSYTILENTIDYTEEFKDNLIDSYMCEYAYDCELDSNGMYSCKYEDEDGVELEISCSSDNKELDLENAIIGNWEPFLIEKDGEIISTNEYYGNEDINRYISFTSYNFKDYTNIYASENEVTGTYEIKDNSIVLKYNDGKIKYIEVDVFGDNNINLNLYDGDTIIYFNSTEGEYYE